MRLSDCFRLGLAIVIVSAMFATSAEAQNPPRIEQFIEGIDAVSKPMSDADIQAQLNDPWATLVLRKDRFPVDIDHILSVLDQADVNHTKQESFFVSETGNLPTNLMIPRSFRIVVTRALPTEASPSILISAPAGNRQGFVEMMSWDPQKKAFNFYRRPSGTIWRWEGDTRHAFQTQTRGKGCFECHIHGVPVQKELALPWSNWHSQQASIPPEAISDAAIRTSPLFLNKSKAERLERVVRRWVVEATSAQVNHLMKGNELPGAPELLRPLFDTTVVNLTSSDDRSNPLGTPPPKLSLPAKFFLDFNVFSNVFALSTPAPFDGEIQRNHYNAALTKWNVQLNDGNGFVRPGDTHFAFLAPEPAFEETELIRQLIAQKVITQHFALCVLTIDFPNPVYSADRAALLKYVPATGYIQNGLADLSERTATAIVQAAGATPDGSPEKQFVTHWNMAPDALRSYCENQIKQYVEAVEARIKTSKGVKDYTRLAAWRRSQFALTPLNESRMLLPKTDVPNTPRLRMNKDGTVSP